MRILNPHPPVPLAKPVRKEFRPVFRVDFE